MIASSFRAWRLMLPRLLSLAAWAGLGLGIFHDARAADGPKAQQRAPGAPAAKKRPAWWIKPVALATTGAPLDGVFGAGGAAQWTVGGDYTVEKDPQVGDFLGVPPDKAVTLTGQTQYAGDRSFRALVRFRPQGPSAGVNFTFARHELKLTDPKDPKLTITKDLSFLLSLSAQKSTGTVYASLSQDGAILYDPKNYENLLDWAAEFSSALAYKLRAADQFMPGWPESLRAELEHDMAELPDLAHKWVEMRVEVRKGSVRAWVDDRLLAQKVDPVIDPSGTLRFDLYSGAELARFETRAIVEPNLPPGFQTIPLGGALNARALLGDAGVQPATLPPADEPVVVGGVPFEFPGVNWEGNDHADIGRSVLRAANWVGNVGTMFGPLARWIGAAERDPARIQVRIANGQFKALHLIATSDGDKDAVPSVTAMFYRPGSGFPQSFAADVPLATATTSADKALGVTLTDGRKINLYLVTIPLDPGLLSSFGDLDIVEIELTKQVQLYRSYPDPISYSYHQSGLPSSVHVYAATLEKVPVGFEWNPVPFGHVWQAPAVPQYVATLTNHTAAAQTGKLTVTTRSFDGKEETKQEVDVALPAAAPMQMPVPVRLTVNVPVKLYGYHDIVATLSLGDQKWTEKRSLVSLAPDTRSVRWTPGRGTQFGYWSYGGGHHTPKNEHPVRLMTMAGARTCIGIPEKLPDAKVQALVEKHWGKQPGSPFTVFPQPWAENEPFDPAKVEEFTKHILTSWHKEFDGVSAEHRPDHVYIFAEPSISARLSAGNVPDYWGEKPYELTPEEQSRLKMHFNTAKIAAQAVRKEFPGIKIFIPWGDPGFTWPLLRAGFPKDLIDGIGLDVPGFERIPERQLHEQSIHRLSYVKREFEKAGIPKPDMRFIEGIFVPTEPGAVTWREQMDIYHRWSLISMAYGVTTFYSGWFAFDCTNYYGAEHYGGCGIQGKIPYCNPKPAYAAYATMTDKLNEANFDGWLDTGSLTTYALRFKKPDNKGYVYALWSLRGKRPVTLTLDADVAVNVTDSMNNTVPVQSTGKQITVSTDPSVIYISFPTPTGQIAAAAVGDADNSDAKPAADAKLVADLGDGSWAFTGERDKTLETNHWAMMHYAGKFTANVTKDPAQGRVLTSKLEKQGQVHELMPWYNVLRPKKPIVLDGAPSKIGLWVRGASDWGRVIYVLRDAQGERWESIGTKDDFNCDDVHSWSMFNFDGWRYLTFELPGHAPWDSFRKYGTTWWRADEGDTVVDLPLSLEAIVVEQRSHIMYVNDVQPAPSDTVSFGKLYAEYETPADATPEAVRLSKLRMPIPQGAANLPNPIAELTQSGVGAPTQLVKIRPPDHQYDGTRAHFDFKEVPGAKAYHLWVSAHPDGRGAMNMLPGGITNGQLVYGFRPGIKLYYWLTYTDAADKESKPSPVVEQVLIDTFKEK